MKLEVGKCGEDPDKAVELLGWPLACGADWMVALVEGNGGGARVLAPVTGVIDALLPAPPVNDKDELGILDGDRLIEDTGGVPETGCAVDGADEELVAGPMPGRVELVSRADSEVPLEIGKGAGETDNLGLDVEAPCGPVVKGEGALGLSDLVGAEMLPGIEVIVLLGTGVENPWPPGPGIEVLEGKLTDEREPMPVPPLMVGDSGSIGPILAVEFDVGNGGSG